jgi:hypothetical protein
MNIQVHEAFRTPNRHDQRKTSPDCIIVKMQRILRAAREKLLATYEGKSITITADLSAETLKVRKAWTDVF